MTVVIDTREQLPYVFPEPTKAVRKTLRTGDYSVAGYEERVAIERKRAEELFQCAGRDRARFTRELERLSHMEYAAIVIEANLIDVAAPSVFSLVSHKAVVRSLISWSIRYGIHVFFAGNRMYAQAVTLRILQKFLKHRGGSSAG